MVADVSDMVVAPVEVAAVAPVEVAALRIDSRRRGSNTLSGIYLIRYFRDNDRQDGVRRFLHAFNCILIHILNAINCVV